MKMNTDWNFRPIQKGSPASQDLLDRRQQTQYGTAVLDGAIVTEEIIGGVDCICVSAVRPTRTILHMHGGGFRLGWPRTWLNYASDIALQANCRVVIPDYKLAPEFPYPSALIDMLGLYEELGDFGTVLIGGDSAGGALATSLILVLASVQFALPAGVILISPWLDLTVMADSYQRNKKTDALFSEEAATEAAQSYLLDVPATDPIASPMHGDLRGFPPTIIFAGSDEVLVDDSVKFAKIGLEVGNYVELHIVSKMQHIWPIISLSESETVIARRKIADFILNAT